MPLLCFPFSGSSSSIYLTWFKNIDHRVELIPVELAGRNKRFSEPLIDSLESTVNDLIHRLAYHFQTPYALFGHSLGCLIIYELVQTIIKYRYPIPVHIFLSGGVPPHDKKNETQIHLLPDEDFLAEIAKMGGMTKDFLNSKELQSIFLPILRSDYKMYETYFPQTNKFLFPCDITILAGDQDNIATTKQAENWRDYTMKNFELIIYEGNHFFIKNHSDEITHLISNRLSQKL